MQESTILLLYILTKLMNCVLRSRVFVLNQWFDIYFYFMFHHCFTVKSQHEVDEMVHSVLFECKCKILFQCGFYSYSLHYSCTDLIRIHHYGIFKKLLQTF